MHMQYAQNMDENETKNHPNAQPDIIRMGEVEYHEKNVK